MKPMPMFVMLAVAGALCAWAACADDEQPLAQVNGHVITRSELDRYVQMAPGISLPEVGEGGVSPAEYAQVRAQVEAEALRSLIQRHLILERAREEYAWAPGSDERLQLFADEEMRKLERRAGGPVNARRALAGMSMTAEQYRQLQVEGVLIAQFMWEKVTSRARVTPSEIRAYYAEHRDEFAVPARIVYRQILLPVGDAGVEEERQRAEGLLEALRAGADFAVLADEHSADAESYPGGLHEVELPADSPDWRPPAVRSLEPGQTSEVAFVAGCFTIVHFQGVYPARVRSFAEAQAEIRQMLLQRARAEAENEFLDRLLDDAQVDIYPGALSGVPQADAPDAP